MGVLWEAGPSCRCFAACQVELGAGMACILELQLQRLLVTADQSDVRGCCPTGVQGVLQGNAKQYSR